MSRNRGRSPGGDAAAVALAVMLASAAANAQATTPTRKPSAAAARSVVVEIRAQAPTPQVITVRPRVIPAFPPEAIDEGFLDRHLWTAVRAPYVLVPAPLPAPAAGPPSLSSEPVPPAIQRAPPQER